MGLKLSEVKTLLDNEVEARNNSAELSFDKPDPLFVASQYQDESIALICALFGYGNAGLIVQFLQSLNFSLLDASDEQIKKALSTHYYRFQKNEDVSTLFIALKRLRRVESIEDIFYTGYKKEENILDGLWHFIERLQSVCPRETRGYSFLVGSVPKKVLSAGTYKRYMMYLRWMVRKDALDMGLWSRIDKKDLLMPLDTHTFQVSRRLGLLKRKTYDMKASIELTETLRTFDEKDPIKYDFALYRLGQEKLL
ncbi:TIGR02757 family protein [Sulfurovum sp. XGS-02]|uniref:TIGR02757 family protein n=1 Tax=Sulfurovum sp. XGS-02 TaxID=2925411 RepID=UPI00206C0868|nr:TIGR02757 family protein [Sulfurovum sp. XGS-02]UPT76849.1 TIGR02757 family protein [Sulfurovum sp. XGS-02]